MGNIRSFQAEQQQIDLTPVGTRATRGLQGGLRVIPGVARLEKQLHDDRIVNRGVVLDRHAHANIQVAWAPEDAQAVLTLLSRCSTDSTRSGERLHPGKEGGVTGGHTEGRNVVKNV